MTLPAPYRPSIHFTPETSWINDPNGCIYHQGLYHLFFQYYPDDIKWGPMHWGHATSPDLIKWSQHDIALYPDSLLGAIFSGSAVNDKHNVSGLFNDDKGLIAFYTSHLERQAPLGPLQQQCIAFSKDNGFTWEKYEKNPVITNPGIPDFRDPKVIYHEESGHWILIAVAGQQVNFYKSLDLLTWEDAGVFGKDQHNDSLVWECPDLMQLQDQYGTSYWVLFISCVSSQEKPFPPMQYFIGEFDGHTFKETHQNDRVNVVDDGYDFYAAQSFFEAKSESDKPIWLAWANHWPYANLIPNNGWRGTMSLPRELSLLKKANEIALAQQPISAVCDHFTHTSTASENTLTLSTAVGTVHKLSVHLSNANQSSANFEVKAGASQSAIFNWDSSSKTFSLDRSALKPEHFHDLYDQLVVADLSKEMAETDTLSADIYIDQSIIEVFFFDGERVMTSLVFPNTTFSSFISHTEQLNTTYSMVTI